MTYAPAIAIENDENKAPRVPRFYFDTEIMRYEYMLFISDHTKFGPAELTRIGPAARSDTVLVFWGIKLRISAALTAAALIASMNQSAFAGATLQGAGATVNNGVGFVALAPGADLAPGMRIRMSDAAKLATLKFADGCEVPLSPGQVFTVGDVSPCAFKGQAEAGAAGAYAGWSTAAIIGALAGLGALGATAALIASSKSGDSAQRNSALAALLALSH